MTLIIAFFVGVGVGFLLGYYTRYNQLERRIEQIQLAQESLQKELREMRNQLPPF